jgi:hypothetical protein
MQVFAIENLELLEQGPILNNQHNPQDPFLLLSDRQFIRMFRLSKNVCRWLIDFLEPYMRPQIRRRDLDVKTRVGMYSYIIILYYGIHFINMLPTYLFIYRF